uniref:Uncharacterized protein n=1 Tax=Talaromyces marneffei PM1 TaxID=1077442 RepID=A0A093VGV2_TALMA
MYQYLWSDTRYFLRIDTALRRQDMIMNNTGIIAHTFHSNTDRERRHLTTADMQEADTECQNPDPNDLASMTNKKYQGY